MNTYKNILLTLDGSDLARQALPHAVGLAAHYGAKLTLIQVVPGLEQVVWVEYADPVGLNMTSLEESISKSVELARSALNELASGLSAERIAINVVVEAGNAADQIIRYAHDKKIDLIVMSTHGRSGLSRLIYGSVAGRVLSHATCPVLLIPAQTAAEEKAVGRVKREIEPA